jgi:hypothetical protein
LQVDLSHFEPPDKILPMKCRPLNIAAGLSLILGIGILIAQHRDSTSWGTLAMPTTSNRQEWVNINISDSRLWIRGYVFSRNPNIPQSYVSVSSGFHSNKDFIRLLLLSRTGDVRGTVINASPLVACSISIWYCVCLTMVLPLGQLLLWLKKKPDRSGLCEFCGYDLRGTPNRCPECGALSNQDKDASL